MLIPIATLAGIKSGDVSLAFRRWSKPTVKAGGTLKTAIGVLAIESVEKISLSKISAADARRAGYASRPALIQELKKRNGQLFKITLSYAGADPRIKLRENSQLSRADVGEIRERLAQMDARSKSGRWTLRTLRVIKKHPRTLAAKVASEVGMDKATFKTNVRKLKNLGLTISQETGYTLSPRGVVLLKHLREDA